MDEFELRVSDGPGALADLRHAVRGWLERLDIVEQDIVAIVTACSEVVADGIDTGPVDVRGVLAGGDVVIRCMGAHGWQFEDHASRYVAALLVDDVSIDRSSNSTSAVLRKAASRGLR